MSDSDGDEISCPICYEPMDATDLSVVPCPCGFQLCALCYDHILKQTNSKCPACRADYDPTKIVNVEVPKKRLKSKDRSVKKPLDPITSRRSDRDMRADRSDRGGMGGVLPSNKVRHVVYVTGLPEDIADKATLAKNEYFGQYGQILKMQVYKHHHSHGSHGHPVYNAQITFSQREEAQAAVSAINGYRISSDLVIRANLFGERREAPRRDLQQRPSRFEEDDNQQKPYLDDASVTNNNPGSTGAAGKISSSSASASSNNNNTSNISSSNNNNNNIAVPTTSNSNADNDPPALKAPHGLAQLLQSSNLAPSRSMQSGSRLPWFMDPGFSQAALSAAMFASQRQAQVQQLVGNGVLPRQSGTPLQKQFTGSAQLNGQLAKSANGLPMSLSNNPLFEGIKSSNAKDLLANARMASVHPVRQ